MEHYLPLLLGILALLVFGGFAAVEYGHRRARRENRKRGSRRNDKIDLL